MGADIIVNTDADNQYDATCIGDLIKPVLRGEADIVIGARDILSIKEFSFIKKILQKLGSAVLRLLSSTKVQDAPSGFRAFSKEAALKLNVFDNYTYTMETLLQAGAKGLKVVSVPVRVNPQLRKSKLVKNIFSYVVKSMKTTVRMFIVYRPFRFFITFSLISALLGLFLVGRFLYFYLLGQGNGHIQSLIFAAVFLISSVQLAIVAVLGDLLSINRKLLEDIQIRIKNFELKNKNRLWKAAKEKEKGKDIDILRDNVSVFEGIEKYQKPVYKFIGIAFKTYIIIEIGQEMYIIDQHAAHERIMYEKVKENYYSESSKDSQMLLLPDVITLTHKEMDIAKDNMEMFRKAGFTLEEFGENTIKLTGVPTVCIDLDTKELFLETLDEINTVARTAKQEKEEKFIATVACKAAVKANMALDAKEVESLMDKLLALPNPFTCPHGRPTAIKMTKYDIERKFARK